MFKSQGICIALLVTVSQAVWVRDPAPLTFKAVDAAAKEAFQCDKKNPYAAEAVPEMRTCDGIGDCGNQYDEDAALCIHKKLVDFNDETYGMLHPSDVNQTTIPRAGQITWKAEVYYLEAADRSPLLTAMGWSHPGLGFRFINGESRELGRLQLQYREASDKQGVLMFKRSRNSWEDGFWGRSELVGELVGAEYNWKLQNLEKWVQEHPTYADHGVMKDGAVVSKQVTSATMVQDMLKEFVGKDVMEDLWWSKVALRYIDETGATTWTWSWGLKFYLASVTSTVSIVLLSSFIGARLYLSKKTMA